ncbi:MAG: hypothetical protein UX23_C0018G0005 [Parcubacteria group bacterium GW2011_GWB1_45_9]|nr:MAG: hypothetical protein UX23_C0018G0005 [Parcubacteria group bacterium GW2011_GWB1_45_9]
MVSDSSRRSEAESERKFLAGEFDSVSARKTGGRTREKLTGSVQVGIRAARHAKNLAERFHDRVQVAVKNLFYVMEFFSDSVVGDSVFRKIIGAYFF